jgi:hypothetical protein
VDLGPDEQVIDTLHKAVYAFTTGALAEQLLAGAVRFALRVNTSTFRRLTAGS